jgi:hypothetical protein
MMMPYVNESDYHELLLRDVERDKLADALAAAHAEIAALQELAHDMLLDIEGTRIFLVTREKMHECGVQMRDDLIARAREILQVQL